MYTYTSSIALRMPFDAANCASIYINTYTYILLWAPSLCGCHLMLPIALQKKSFSHICTYIKYTYKYIYYFELHCLANASSDASNSASQEVILSYKCIYPLCIKCIYIYTTLGSLFGGCHQTLPTVLQKKSFSHTRIYIKYTQEYIYTYTTQSSIVWQMPSDAANCASKEVILSYLYTY